MRLHGRQRPAVAAVARKENTGESAESSSSMAQAGEVVNSSSGIVSAFAEQFYSTNYKVLREVWLIWTAGHRACLLASVLGR